MPSNLPTVNLKIVAFPNFFATFYTNLFSMYKTKKQYCEIKLYKKMHVFNMSLKFEQNYPRAPLWLQIQKRRLGGQKWKNRDRLSFLVEILIAPPNNLAILAIFKVTTKTRPKRKDPQNLVQQFSMPIQGQPTYLVFSRTVNFSVDSWYLFPLVV